MTSDPGFERRVARLENETVSIYELLTEVKSVQDAHSHQLRQIGGGLDRHTAQLDQQGARLDRQGVQLDQQGALLDQQGVQLDRHSAHFQNIETTLDEVLRRLPEPS